MGSRMADGMIEKASEAYLVSRGIHDLGFALSSMMMLERLQCARAAAMGDGVPPTLTGEDIKNITSGYLLFNVLCHIGLANGFLRFGSDAYDHVLVKHVEVIEKNMDALFTKLGKPEVVANLRAQAQGFRDEIDERIARHGPSGLCRPPFSRAIRRAKLKQSLLVE